MVGLGLPGVGMVDHIGFIRCVVMYLEVRDKRGNTFKTVR